MWFNDDRTPPHDTATIARTDEGWRIDANGVTALFMTALAHTQADVDALARHLVRQGIRVVREEVP